MVKAGSGSNTPRPPLDNSLSLDMGYTITEPEQMRLDQVAKACDYMADLAEVVTPSDHHITTEHFAPMLRLMGYVTADIAATGRFAIMRTKN